jgi:outer membrane receptor protein involved in Fe transport
MQAVYINVRQLGNKFNFTSEKNKMKRLLSSLAVLLLIISYQFTIQAQTTTGSLSGTVTDPNGAVLPSAAVTVKNNETGTERTATTNENGQFNIAVLEPGNYSVSVESTGFKRTVAPNVVINVSQSAEVTIAMEVGATTETVTVTAAQEVVNSTSPSITNVINTQQVRDLPLAGRNPLELAGLQAGIAVNGTDVRGSSVGGLRQSTTNITQDGINVQDMFVKTSSFFAMSSPAISSIGEFSITTNTVGADQGRGVGQVNMVTKSGTNDFHGGVFYMGRNEALNANSFFNNFAGTARPRQRQHFYGGDIGGPMYFLNFGDGGPTIFKGKDRAFFFFSFEGFRENFQVTRNRTVLTQEARQGIFRYTGTNGQLQTVNLLQLGNVGTLNPFMATELARTPLPNNNLVGDNFNTAGYRFNVSGLDQNRKYAFRYDHQLVKDSPAGAHKLEFVFSKAVFDTSPDTLNLSDPPFPGAPFSSQASSRWLITPALVSTFGNMTNSLRYGRQWAPVDFPRNGELPQQFIVNSCCTDFDASGNVSQGRTTTINEIRDDFIMPKGNHLFKLGFDYQKTFLDQYNDVGIVKSITLGTNSSNPSGILQSELPLSVSADLTRATNVYTTIVGNLASASQTFNVTSPDSGFVPGAPRKRQLQTKDLAIYGQDQWRVFPNLTLTGGLRWEYFGVPTVPNGLAFVPIDPLSIYGVSGEGNLFKPNAPAGLTTVSTNLNFLGDNKFYPEDYNNFAPSVGIAYSPDFKSGLLRTLFGSEGRSSIRAGYSQSFVKEGLTILSAIQGNTTTNPGLIQTVNNTVPTGVLTAAGVSLTAPTFSVPVTSRQNLLLNQSSGVFSVDPNIVTPYVHQWSVGYEREILPQTAIEIRYVGNSAKKQWRAFNVNEVNIFENGFLQEFLNAQKNLALRGGSSFAPGCAGCVDLPILNRFFAGLAATSGFTSSTFISNLTANNVGTFASTLAFSPTYRANRENPANGIAANFFVANPNAGFAQILTNEGESNYHSLQVELRRRLSNGLQFQADYTFSKTLTNCADCYGNNQTDLASFRSLRDKDLDWRRSNNDQTHRFVANGLYELPFGKGRAFLDGAHPVIDRIVGDWNLGAIVAWQTRQPFFVASNRTTFNSFNSANNPADLVGITFEEFKKNLGVYKTPTGVYFINPDLLDITVNPATGAFVSSKLKPGLMAAPAPGTFGNFPMNSLNGPAYFNLDLSLTKRLRITENLRLELKTTAINVLNRASFVYGTQNFDATNFGRITGQSNNSRIVHFEGRVRF